MAADLAEEFSVGRELEELRSACAIGGTGGIAAREDEDVAFGIDGDAGGFTEMDVRRKFQKVGDRLETDFGRLLGEKRDGRKKEQNNRAFHVIQPRYFAPHHTRVWGISRLSRICMSRICIGLALVEPRTGGRCGRAENQQRVCWI